MREAAWSPPLEETDSEPRRGHTNTENPVGNETVDVTKSRFPVLFAGWERTTPHSVLEDPPQA